jgi:hypothetical protein
MFVRSVKTHLLHTAHTIDQVPGWELAPAFPANGHHRRPERLAIEVRGDGDFLYRWSETRAQQRSLPALPMSAQQRG